MYFSKFLFFFKYKCVISDCLPCKSSVLFPGSLFQNTECVALDCLSCKNLVLFSGLLFQRSECVVLDNLTFKMLLFFPSLLYRSSECVTLYSFTCKNFGFLYIQCKTLRSFLINLLMNMQAINKEKAAYFYTLCRFYII